MPAVASEPAQPVVAVGPELPDWGSWQWVGAHLLDDLCGTYRMLTFRPWDVPSCDVLVLVKHLPTWEFLAALPDRASIVYCPIDQFGSATEIDAAGPLLRRFARVVIHCERLRRYFEPYTSVVYLDHHVKFTAVPPDKPHPDGFFLWVGVRTNLPPLIDWIDSHPLPGELVILTNPENPAAPPTSSQLGFRGRQPVRVEVWSAELQEIRTGECRAALDVKGDDFRSRHKSPAKAIDFIASGVPLAMNPGSSPVEHLARLGFEVPSPLALDRWLACNYWEETQRFGAALREMYSRRRVAYRMLQIIEEALAERSPR